MNAAPSLLAQSFDPALASELAPDLGVGRGTDIHHYR
jgi:hypothetical protein